MGLGRSMLTCPPLVVTSYINMSVLWPHLHTVMRHAVDIGSQLNSNFLNGETEADVALAHLGLQINPPRHSSLISQLNEIPPYSFTYNFGMHAAPPVEHMDMAIVLRVISSIGTYFHESAMTHWWPLKFAMTQKNKQHHALACQHCSQPPRERFNTPPAMNSETTGGRYS